MQAFITLLLCMVCIAMGDDVLLQKRMSSGEPVEQYDPIRAVKKPFCNAFTGCGKRSGKRSGESLDSLVDLSGEPAVEDLRRQILSEAKLWEAIQEARMELGNARQRQDEAEVPARPFPLTAGHKRAQYYYT